MPPFFLFLLSILSEKCFSLYLPPFHTFKKLHMNYMLLRFFPPLNQTVVIFLCLFVFFPRIKIAMNELEHPVCVSFIVSISL